jgi:hypothetical protein
MWFEIQNDNNDDFKKAINNFYKRCFLEGGKDTIIKIKYMLSKVAKPKKKENNY